MIFRLAGGLATVVTLLAGLAAAQPTVAPRKPAPGAQVPGAPAADAPPARALLSATTNLVLVPTSVSDPMARPVTGLEKENFKLFDNGVEQPITHFAMEDEPIAVALIFDVSGSMGYRLRQSRVAAQQFFRTADPSDECALIEFDSKPRLVMPLGAGLGSLKEDLVFTKSGGSTALVDAVVLGLHEIKKSKLTRKALIIISDGGENNSRYTLKEVRNMARESDALIYAILIEDEERDGPWFLRQLTEDSGGRVVPYGLDAIEPITKISIELRNRYLLGFEPSDDKRDGKYHALTVKLIPPRGMPKLHADWRRGYYAASD
ncbi:MAG TPA: VWA domain-containing protein [Bryobacteraceae bacterium]|nr:VWA domain-containing protein [Bryobacteraceae bacterium]